MNVETYASLCNQALEKVELAGAYLNDGAPRTAADRLRIAAALLDRAANLEFRSLALAKGEAQ